MAFCTTYKSILDRNIRHIYSGLPTDIRFRKQGFNQKLDAPKRIHEQQLKPPDRFEVKFLHYIPEQDICIPKAPAFRAFSAKDVDRIVERLSQGTKSRPRTTESATCPREETRCLKETCAYCQLAAMPDMYSKRRVDAITQRLMQPTISSAVRSKMRPKSRWTLPEVSDSCVKHNRPHSHYFIRSKDCTNVL